MKTKLKLRRTTVTGDKLHASVSSRKNRRQKTINEICATKYLNIAKLFELKEVISKLNY